MKASLLIIVTLGSLGCCVKSYVVNPGPLYVATKGAVWPKPQHQDLFDDYLVLTPRTFSFIVAENGSDCNLLQNAFQRYFKILQENTIPRVSKSAGSRTKRLHIISAPVGDYLGVLTQLIVNLQGKCDDSEYPSLKMSEEYNLAITKDASELTASSIWGILRGLETFSQLTYLGDDGLSVRINSTFIHDFPRFKHRGLLVDTSRHYIPMEKLYQIIDGMAYNKLNVFHWHIVDDQSFPFVSKTFPELSQLGAYHSELMIYTPDDVQEIIEFSRQRGIRVMPEFDTPGHTRSWGISHPELLTDCSSIQKGSYGPIDPSKNTTYSFLNGLLSEIREVFKDSYVHLGGDEVDFDCWEKDANIVKFMADNNIKTFEGLESYYIQKIINAADKLKFNTVVWEEVFRNGVELPQNTIVQVWRDWEGYLWNDTMFNVTKEGKQALLSSCWYLDHLSTGGDWLDFYKCEPTEFGGSKAQTELVLGGETCMWAEVVNEYNIVQRIFPRVSAPSERLWSAYENVTSDDFDFIDAARRLEEHVCRMNRRGLPAQPPTASGFCL